MVLMLSFRQAVVLRVLHDRFLHLSFALSIVLQLLIRQQIRDTEPQEEQFGLGERLQRGDDHVIEPVYGPIALARIDRLLIGTPSDSQRLHLAGINVELELFKVDTANEEGKELVPWSLERCRVVMPYHQLCLLDRDLQPPNLVEVVLSTANAVEYPK